MVARRAPRLGRGDRLRTALPAHRCGRPRGGSGALAPRCAPGPARRHDRARDRSRRRAGRRSAPGDPARGRAVRPGRRGTTRAPGSGRPARRSGRSGARAARRALDHRGGHPARRDRIGDRHRLGGHWHHAGHGRAARGGPGRCRRRRRESRATRRRVASPRPGRGHHHRAGRPADRRSLLGAGRSQLHRSRRRRHHHGSASGRAAGARHRQGDPALGQCRPRPGADLDPGGHDRAHLARSGHPAHRRRPRRPGRTAARPARRGHRQHRLD